MTARPIRLCGSATVLVLARWLRAALVARLFGIVLLASGLFGLGVAGPAAVAAQPAITRPVTDETGVLSRGAIEAIEARLLAHREEGHAQIALLLVRTTHGEPIQDYANRVAERWAGGTRGLDDGVLFVLALDDREMRIEVGYGLEAQLTDATAMRILDELVVPLRERRLDAAAWIVSDALIARTGGQSSPPPSGIVTGAATPPATPAAGTSEARDALPPPPPARERPSRAHDRRDGAGSRGLWILAASSVSSLLLFAYFWQGSNTTYDANGVARTDWRGFAFWLARIVPLLVVFFCVLLVLDAWGAGFVTQVFFAGFSVALVGFAMFGYEIHRLIRRGTPGGGGSAGGAAGGSGGGSAASSGAGAWRPSASVGASSVHVPSHTSREPRHHHGHASAAHSHASHFGHEGGGASKKSSHGGGGGHFGGGGASKRW